MNNCPEIMKKSLIYKSSYRGFKELEIILKKFLNSKCFMNLTSKDIEGFNELLNMNDHDLYKLIICNKPDIDLSILNILTKIRKTLKIHN